jgi:hypothetical protein
VPYLNYVGLDRALSTGLEPWRKPTAVHNPAKIVLDLALSLALAVTAWPTSPPCARPRPPANPGHHRRPSRGTITTAKITKNPG